MTSSVTIKAHPGAGVNAVEVNVYKEGDDGSEVRQTTNLIILNGAEKTFFIAGSDRLYVKETLVDIVQPAAQDENAG